MPFYRGLAVFLAFAGLTNAASARTTLVESQPEQGTIVSQPTAFDLTFSEAVAPADLSITLTMTAMPGMAHHRPMTIKGFDVVPVGTKVTLHFPRPLPSGTYRLDWTARVAPAEPATGSVTFKVS
jgi:hypothetical protein